MVTIELEEYTIEAIEKAKEILSSDPRFRWIKKVDIDVFLNILLGWADISQVMRNTLSKLFEPKIQTEILSSLEIKEPDLPKPVGKPIGYYTEYQARILKAMLRYDIPLSIEQIAMIMGAEKEKIRGTITTHLKNKVLVEKIEVTLLWKLNKDRLRKFALKPEPTRKLIAKLLEKEKKAMSIDEIARKICRKRSTVDAELYKMRKKGIAKLVKPGVFVLIER